jgi:hypothetical protein
LAVQTANSAATPARPQTAPSFVQLQARNADLWKYRTNPE